MEQKSLNSNLNTLGFPKLILQYLESILKQYYEAKGQKEIFGGENLYLKKLTTHKNTN